MTTEGAALREHSDVYHRGEALLVWRRRHSSLSGSIPSADPFARDSAPAISRETVIAGRGSPGQLWAMWKTTGDVAWSRAPAHVRGIVVHDDRVYTHAEDRIICLDSATGATIWETPSWLTPKGPNPEFSVSARPSFVGERIFWASSVGIVRCAEARSGNEVWRVQIPGGNAIVSALLVADGRLVAAALPSTLFALDAADGRLVWSRDLPSVTVWRPLAGMGGILVRLDDRLLVLRSDDGVIVGKWSWPDRNIGSVASGANAAFAVRSEVEDRVIMGERYVLSARAMIVQLAPDGATSWEIPSPVPNPSIIFDDASGCLFEACGGLGIIDPLLGRRRHMVGLEGAQFLATPAIDGDHIYLTNVDGEIVALKSPIVQGPVGVS
jgi:outer membrane protein assembly factor BamB